MSEKFSQCDCKGVAVMGARHGRDRFHTVPIFSLGLNNFNKGNMELRVHQAYPPTPRNLERRQEKLGTRMERVPTTRSDLLRAGKAMTLMFLGHSQDPSPQHPSQFADGSLREM